MSSGFSCDELDTLFASSILTPVYTLLPTANLPSIGPIIVYILGADTSDDPSYNWLKQSVGF